MKKESLTPPLKAQQASNMPQGSSQNQRKRQEKLAAALRTNLLRRKGKTPSDSSRES